MVGGAALLSGWSGAGLAQTAVPPKTPPEIAAELPGASLRGSATMRFLGLRIYDGRVWSAQPVHGDGAAQTLAIELIYARSLVGSLIAKRSIGEMRGIAPFSEAHSARWLQAMTALFPDVAAGDRLTGVQRPGQAARFFFNGALRGEVADAEFTRLFFGIWLSPKTSEPALRAQMIGSGAP